MATEAGRVYFTIGAEADEADKEVKRSFGDMAKSAVKLAAAIYVAKKAFDLVTSTFTEASAAAAFADTTITDLAASMARAGEKDVRAATESFLAFAGELQNLTGISDEMISQAGTLGASFGITGKELETATMAAVDMAKVMKSDASAAMSLIARAASSGTNALSRYGIEMKESEDQGVRLASILESINEKFGGAAAVAVQTHAGRVKILSENVGDLREEFGRSVTQSETWNALIEESTQVVIELFDELKGNRGWLESFLSSLVSAGGAIAHVFIALGEAGSKAFLGLKAAGELVMAGLVGWKALPPLIQIGFGKMAEAIIDHFMGIAEAALALPGPLGDAAAQAVGKLALLRVNVAMNEEAAKQAVKAVRAESDAWVDAATDTAVAIEDIGANADQARGRVDQFVDAVRRAAETVIVDPITAAGEGKGPGGAGKPPADDSTAVAAENYVSIWDLAFDQMKVLYEKNKQAAQEAEAAKQAMVMATAARIGDASGAIFAGFAAGSEESGEAVKRMALSMTSMIRDMAVKSITAYAASTAGAAAFSQAGIPVIGPILAVGAASAAFALVSAYLTKMHEGGIVGGSGSGREVGIVAEKGELILPVDVTRQLLASGRRRQIPALAGGGGGSAGGGDTFVANLYSFMPGQNSDLMNATREQERMRDKMRRRGVIEGDGGDT